MDVPNLVSHQKENIKSLDKEEGLEKSELYLKNQETCNMNMHPVESVHEGKKPFRCSMCDKHYQDPDALEIHKVNFQIKLSILYQQKSTFQMHISSFQSEDRIKKPYFSKREVF